jgi:hypothetical protein
VLELVGYFNEIYIYYKIELHPNPHCRKTLKDGYYIKQLNLHDFNRSGIIEFDQGKIDLFKRRLGSREYLAFGIFKVALLVYYFWLALKEIELHQSLAVKCTLVLAPDSGYLVDGYCHPDHRGQGLHGYMTCYLLQVLAKYGRQYAITIIQKENRAARKSQEGIGEQAEFIKIRY